MLELIGTTEYSTISGGNPYAEKILHRIRSLEIDSPIVAGIGVGIGATTIKIAKELNNKGAIHLFDFTERLAVIRSSAARLFQYRVLWKYVETLGFIPLDTRQIPA
jgi:hypothetical protein